MGYEHQAQVNHQKASSGHAAAQAVLWTEVTSPVIIFVKTTIPYKWFRRHLVASTTGWCKASGSSQATIAATGAPYRTGLVASALFTGLGPAAAPPTPLISPVPTPWLLVMAATHCWIQLSGLSPYPATANRSWWREWKGGKVHCARGSALAATENDVAGSSGTGALTCTAATVGTAKSDDCPVAPQWVIR